MPIFIEIGRLVVWFWLICQKLCLNVGLSSKIPIYGFSSPISEHIELKFCAHVMVPFFLRARNKGTVTWAHEIFVVTQSNPSVNDEISD